MILALLLGAAALTSGARGGPATQPGVLTPPSVLEKHTIRRDDGAARSPATPSSVADPSRGRPGGGGLDMRRVGLSLAIVLGLVVLARFAMKRLFPAVSVGRHSQVIRVVSRSVVGPKQQFLLVQLGKRLVLVGDSGASMSPLAEVNDPDEVAELIGKLQSESSASSVSGFASLFRKAGSEFQREQDREIPSVDKPTQRTEDMRDENEATPPNRELVEAASEISGLMDRVRLLSGRAKQG